MLNKNIPITNPLKADISVYILYGIISLYGISSLIDIQILIYILTVAFSVGAIVLFFYYLKIEKKLNKKNITYEDAEKSTFHGLLWTPFIILIIYSYSFIAIKSVSFDKEQLALIVTALFIVTSLALVGMFFFWYRKIDLKLKKK